MTIHLVVTRRARSRAGSPFVRALSLVLLVGAFALSTACGGGDSGDPDPDAGADASDGGIDDTETDAPADTGSDASADADPDAGLDTGLDTGLDSGSDAGSDAGGTDAGDASTDSGTDVGPEGSCERSPERIAARERCVGDVTCPCGTYCDLGVCVADCEASDECSEGFGCDDFGRCRAQDSPSLAPAPSGEAVGELRASPSVISFTDSRRADTIILDVLDAGAERIRVLAYDGAQIDCDGVLSDECLLEDVAADARLTFEVAAPEDVGLGADADPRIAFVSARERVSVTLLETEGSADTKAFEDDLPGTYVGTAVMMGAGVGEADDDTQSVGRAEFPLEAALHLDGGDYVLSLTDPFHALTPRGELVAALSLDEGDAALNTLTIPAHAVLAGGLEPNAEFDVVAEYVGRFVGVDTSASPTLSIDLTQRFTGVLPGDAAPQVDWSLSFVRTGDLGGESAPVLPPSDLLANDPDVSAYALTPWENALSSASPSAILSRSEAELVQFAELESRAGATTTDLQSCTYLDPTDWDTVAHTVTEALWDTSWDLDLPRQDDPLLLWDIADSTESLTARLLLWTHPEDANLDAYSEVDFPSRFTFTISDGGVELPFGDDFSPYIPCGASLNVEIESGNSEFSCGFNAPPSPGTTERVTSSLPDTVCEDIAARFGCEIDEIEASSIPFASSFTYASRNEPVEGFELFVCREYVTRDTTLTMDRVCRFSGAPPTPCVDGLLCANGQVAPSWTGALFDASFLTTSGDLGCSDEREENRLTGAITIDLEAATTRVPTANLVNDCLGDLSLFRETAAPASIDPTPAGLNALFGTSAACVDVSRHLLATSMALAPFRVARPSEGEWADTRARMGARLVQRWVELLGGVALEKSQRASFDILFGGGGPDLDAEAVLEQSLAGYDLVFHPRYASGLVNLPADALRDPDYRDEITGETGFPNTSHAVALPVSMVDALNAQLTLVLSIHERAALTSDLAAVDALRQTLTRAPIVQALATHLAERAATEGTPTWWPRWEQAQRETTRLLERAAGAALGLQSATNPLGIEESDLPLYFLGDEVGPGGRFAAVSDYIVGSPSRPDAWAPSLVSTAEATFEDARAAYLTQRDRAYQAQLSDEDQTARIEAIVSEINNQLSDFCGPQTSASIENDDFSPTSCFIDDEPACDFGRADIYEGFEAADWERMLCPHELATTRFGPAYGFRSLDARAFAETDCDTFELSDAECDGISPCLQCVVGGVPVAELPLHPGSFEFDVPSLDGASNDERESRSRFVAEIQRSCDAAHPAARSPRPTSRERDAARCYRGSIGDAAMEVFTAERTIRLAAQEVANLTEAYDIAAGSCSIFLSANMDIEAANTAHANNLRDLRTVRTGLEAGATAAGAVKDCTATATGVEKPWQAGTAAGSCAAGAAEAGLQIGALIVADQIDNAITAHENATAAAENQRDYEVCRNDARLELVGIRSAYMEATQAAIDQLRAVENFETQLANAESTWRGGRSLLLRMQRRLVTPPLGGDWTDDNVATFARQMRLARRAVYLGVRAVEYEFQSSLDARGDVLAAETPDDLRAIVEQLWLESGPRGINGRMATDLKIVLSLRDDILQIEDTGDAGPGSRPFDAEEQLQLVLSDPSNVVYDESGEVIGRQIPFTLQPLAALGLPTGGVTVFGTSDCAERLWSVNASILGADGASPFVGSDASFTRIDLLKSNVFHSQWCVDDDRDTTFQSASVRPTRNLFQEPGLGSDVGDATGAGDPQETTSRARIQAHFNVSRVDFEDDSFANGDTSELAARGLYGEYALFIPEELISPPAGDDVREDGLALDRIADILIRMDYVSVAR